MSIEVIEFPCSQPGFEGMKDALINFEDQFIVHLRIVGSGEGDWKVYPGRKWSLSRPPMEVLKDSIITDKTDMTPDGFVSVEKFGQAMVWMEPRTVAFAFSDIFLNT